MRLPAFVGRVAYFVGYPIFRLLIKNSYRAYVVVKYENTILVTKNWLGAQKKWRLPGGGVHQNERPARAASRELEEEVGIRIAEKQLTQLTNTAIEARYGYLIELFVINVKSKPRIRIDEREILRAQFVSIDELKRGVISEELAEALVLLES